MVSRFILSIIGIYISQVLAKNLSMLRAEERVQFPELADHEKVSLQQRSDGQVVEIVNL